MMRIERKENGMAKVFTPYNSDFVAKIKKIGGRKWNSAEKCWEVPETEIDTVREYMMAVYGETDKADDSEKVTVKVTFNESEWAVCDSLFLFGKAIARATGRDSGAKVGDDVTVLSGKLTSGGSARNWQTRAEDGTVIKVRNVPMAALANTNGMNVTVEIIEEKEIDRAALIAEKEKILARLAEIEKLLA